MLMISMMASRGTGVLCRTTPYIAKVSSALSPSGVICSPTSSSGAMLGAELGTVGASYHVERGGRDSRDTPSEKYCSFRIGMEDAGLCWALFGWSVTRSLSSEFQCEVQGPTRLEGRKLERRREKFVGEFVVNAHWVSSALTPSGDFGSLLSARAFFPGLATL